MSTAGQRARARGKDAERQVARRLGGERVGPSGKETPDVEHALFIVEVKNTKGMPESPRVLLQEVAAKRRKGDDRIPLLVYKRPNWHGFIACLDFKDFEDIVGKVKP